MSYIHEALKKAQREKDLLSAKAGRRWGFPRERTPVVKPQWLVTLGLVVIAVAFLSLSWSNSVDEQHTPPRPEPVQHASLKPSQKLPVPQPRQIPSKRVAPEPQTKSETKSEPEKPSPALASEDNEDKKAPLVPKEKLKKDVAETLYRRALASQKKGRFEEGKRLYEEALEYAPHLVRALNNLGTIYIKEKDYAAAGQAFEKAIRIDPGYVDPYYNLACLHALQDDVGRSLFYLKKAISIDKGVRKWAMADQDLKKLHGHSEYENIMQGS
jgi:tetratricopeptide (TPR) repeat protein